MNPLHEILEEWYEAHARDLPWRRTRDPYRIWLSESILQQTRVKQGLAYYERFCRRFPDVGSLAAATQDEVMKLWQGLGYYSRARNLHAAARRIVDRFSGEFPLAYDQVRSLEGVGDYTAAAICSMAYDTPCAVVDGNVYRVLSRLFDIDLPIDSPTGRKAFAELARTQLDTARPGVWNQALMEFGALCCIPSQPLCAECPVREKCLALAAGTVATRPVKRGKATVRPRWFNYLHMVCKGRTLIRRREGSDIWQGLYEFPLIETPQERSFADLAATEEFSHLTGGYEYRLTRTTAMPPHLLSHQRILAVFHHLELARLTDAEGYLIVDEHSLGDYAVARLTERYLLR